VTLAELATAVRDSRGLAHKRDIEAVMQALGQSAFVGEREAVMNGDDCAAIPDGDGYLLFAIEGLLNDFVAAEPWFAGYCGIMVNVSDVYAMGGRPIAVVDAIWSRGRERGRAILEGMAAASTAYGVPIVGGHSNARSEREQLSVAVLGRAARLLTSFDADPGDALVAAIDLRGRYHEPFPFWDASTGVEGARLRGDLDVLPALAAAGLCAAAKDISNASVIGTALMLLECSRLGGVIEVGRVPRPAGAPLARWLLSTFPSYGFLLAVPEPAVAAVLERFGARGIAAASVGRCDDSGVVRLSDGNAEEPVWDFGRERLTGWGLQMETSP